MNVLLINCSPVRIGATAEIMEKVKNYLTNKNTVKIICIDDYDIKFCNGCKSCYKNAKCIHSDDILSTNKQ